MKISSVTNATGLSSFLFPDFAPQLQADLERFRKSWEKLNGPTDVTRYYTSRWPAAERDMLYELDTEMYYKGLPPFVQDYLREQVETATHEGKTDDLPSRYVKLYYDGKMNPSAARSR